MELSFTEKKGTHLKKKEPMNPLEQVSEFHKAFSHPILGSPQIPDMERCKLREHLIQEELTEFMEAWRCKDIVGVADALCDLQYVLSGAVLEFGLKDKFPAMFNEVHRSNMSKACASEQEAMETIACCPYDIDHADLSYEEKDGKYLVYRKSDRKTIKSINYSPADLKQFIPNNQGTSNKN